MERAADKATFHAGFRWEYFKYIYLDPLISNSGKLEPINTKGFS